jgi:hypothetical protein
VTPVDYSDPTTAASNLEFKGVSFFITVLNSAQNPISGALAQAIVITLTGVSVEESDVVYFYDVDADEWVEANSTCSESCPCPQTVIDVDSQTITTATCHLTQFALFQAVAPSSTSGSGSSSSSSNTTLIIEIVVPVGAVVIIAIIIIVAVLRSKRSRNTSPSANSIEMGTKSKPKTQTSPPTQSTVNNCNNSDTLKH